MTGKELTLWLTAVVADGSSRVRGLRGGRRRASLPRARRRQAPPAGIGRQRVQRLALPPDELHPGRHRRPRRSSRSWARASGRSTLFGIPLQQQWSYAQLRRLRADLLPADRRAALLLLVHRRLHRDASTARCTPAEQARFDPMITGFNPADMYAVDHIRRVLQTFPGVFTGIGEFTHPQGVRLVEGRRRDREPDQPRARSHPRLRGRGRPRRDPPQRHRHAVRQGRTPSRST